MPSESGGASMMGAAAVEEPYPHFVRDGVFSDQTRADMHRNWPGKGYFYAEIPGNYVCNLSLLPGSFYWQNFLAQEVPNVIFGTLGVFAPYIKARYPGETQFETYVCALMQSSGNYGGHDVHNHHYHDPTFVATILIYLDTVQTGHHGTTLLRTKPGMDEARCAAKTLMWHDLTEEHRTVEYRPGRIFAFYDNAIAYHEVRPSAPGALFGRRIFRLHVRTDPSHCERLYGVDYETYQKKRRFPSEDPQVLAWMRKDIEEMRSSPKLTLDERAAWLNSISVHIGHMPVEEPGEQAIA